MSEEDQETPETEDNIRTIPVLRRLEKIHCARELSVMQRHLDEAKRINDALAQSIAADDGYIMKEGDEARFGADEEGNITLFVKIAQ